MILVFWFLISKVYFLVKREVLTDNGLCFGILHDRDLIFLTVCDDLPTKSVLFFFFMGSDSTESIYSTLILKRIDFKFPFPFFGKFLPSQLKREKKKKKNIIQQFFEKFYLVI